MTHPGADRGSAAITLAGGAAVLLLIVILISAIAGVTGQQAAACQAPAAASTAAASIPASYLADHQKAGVRYGIPWTVLAGIGTVESDNGQSDLPGVHAGTNPYGAAGPMQVGGCGAARGKPYQWGGTGPDAFDCSGLAMMAYRAADISIPRTSQAQWQFGTRIPESAAEPGDLVFFAGRDGTPQAPGHVGIVIGDGKMIEAYATGYPVLIAAYGQPSSPPGDQVVVGVTAPDVGSHPRCRFLAS